MVDGIFPSSVFPPLQDKLIQCQPKPPDICFTPKVQTTNLIPRKPVITWRANNHREIITYHTGEFARAPNVNSWFELDVQTPNFFAKEAIFSIAGKSLTVDMATKNQTRPSCVKVKIKIEITTKGPNHGGR